MSAAIAFSDPRGFREVYQSHHGFVWHALHRFGLRGAGLEGALQDVFVVAYRRRDDFAGSPKAWLYAIARRVASNHRRSARRRDARADALSGSLSEPRKPVPEAIIALDRYLEGLSDEDRELFVLSEVEGMTGPEIAAAWGRNVNTLYTRIRKLRASLRDEAPAERVRRQRPRASAQAWAALLPSLEPVAGAGVALSGGWMIGIAAAAVGAVVVATQIGPSDAPSPTPPAQPGEVVVAPSDPQPAAIAASPTPAVVEPPQAPVAPPARPRARAPKEPVPPSSTLAQENALLGQARAALQRGDAAEAMRLANKHASKFPDSPLTEVRAVVRIEALCVQGKAPQARAEARVLLEKRPAMTARRRIEKSCAGPPQDPAKPDMTGA